MNTNCQVRNTNGFTLIELLSVVAIVAIIAAILFPVFAGVRERGRRTACQSNLKQMALAMEQYVQDNNGAYPIYANWGYAVYSYTKNTQVFRCTDHPSYKAAGFGYFPEPVPESDTFYSRLADYTYDEQRLCLHSYGAFHGKFWERYDAVYEANFATPATVWLNMDTYDFDQNLFDGQGDGVGVYVRRVATSYGRHFVGSTIHFGGGDYSYLDGHVKWLTPEAAGEIDCANVPWHRFVPSPPH